MASSYPGIFDAAFPGYPYADNVEYVLASQANAWVSAIQAIETAVGYGAGSIAANPLYSAAYGTLYQTITARIAASENNIVALPAIDTNVAHIANVGSAAVAGATGKVADAGHVHKGVTSVNNLYGAVTIDTTLLGGIYATGQVLVGTGAGTAALLSPGTAGYVLQSNGIGNALSWASISPSSGDLKFTSAMNVPSGWLIADGAQVLRSSYPSLLAATTIQATGCSLSGTTVTGGFTQAQLTRLQANGDGYGATYIEGTGVPASTYIQTINPAGLSFTTNNTLTTGGSVTITAFPYGNGDGSLYFNVINMLGRTAVGYNTANSGTNAQPDFGMGAYGGERLHALSSAETGPHTHTGTTGSQNADHVHFPPGYTGGASTGNAFVFANPNNPTLYSTVSLYLSGVDDAHKNTNQGPYASWSGYPNAATTGQKDTTNAAAVHQHAFTSDTGGSGTGHNNMQPFTVGQWLVRT